MAKLDKLINRRNSMTEEFRKLSIKIDAISSVPAAEIDVDEIDVINDLLTKLYNSYSDLNYDIIFIDSSQVNEVDIFDLYQQLLIKIKKIKGKCLPRSSEKDFRSNEPVSYNSRGGKTNLPALEIPVFDGTDVTKFHTFYELFCALIHSENSFTKIQKLCYLKKYLKGEALELISSLPVIDISYDTALGLIKDRFDNKNLIINAHLKHLFDIPVISTGSSRCLREFISKVKQHIGCLRNLGEPVDGWHSILLYVLSQKIDIYTNRAYQLDKDQNDAPDVNEFLIFLEKRAISMEASNVNAYFKGKQKVAVNISTNVPESSTNGSNKKSKKGGSLPTCVYCKTGKHKIYSCALFKNCSVKKRIDFVNEHTICKICLNEHNGDCKFKPCAICAKAHNALLHEEELTNPVNSNNDQTVALHCKSAFTQVLLPTAQVRVKTANNKLVTVKCLLDSGSQMSFITTKLSELLDIKPRFKKFEVTGISADTTIVSQYVTLEINSLVCDYQICHEFSILPHITVRLPQRSFDTSEIIIPNNIQLADINYNEPSEIPMLLGADIFFELLRDGTIRFGPNQPVLQNTLLGYVISGSIATDRVNKRKASGVVALHASNRVLSAEETVVNDNLNELLSRFWETEYLDKNELKSETDICEESFKRGLSTVNGRFQVRFPLRKDADHIKLGDSYSVALKRFINLENRFKKDQILHAQYTRFINDYIRSGHAKVYDLRNYSQNQLPYFVAHHPVIRESNKTTKLRVVFDGSMQSKSGVSLNDIMHNGPMLQAELFDVLIRFRTYHYILVADIKQMYRQILMHPDDRGLQNILWRDSNELPIQCLQLQTITYGLKASPYLATRCLIELAHQEAKRFPLAAEAILNNCYVDDFLCGANTLDDALQLRDQLINLLGTIGMELHKWCSNDQNLLINIAKESQQLSDIEISNDQHVIKTLGLFLDIPADVFKLTCPINELKSICTKRSVLAFISKIYDPLGLVGPIITRAKVIMQKLWQCSISWDERLTSELLDEWNNFALSLINMKVINIPRNCLGKNSQKIELVGYCDASSYAYGCCIYLRVEQSDGTVKVTLLCSKSRIAPIRQKLTIPKLELNSAFLLAKLVHRTYKILRPLVSNTFLYTDSTIALAWIRSNAIKLTVYVANRVKQIQELTVNMNWLYIESQQNPADCISRGADACSLQTNLLWWHGPPNLSDINFEHVLSKEALLSENKVPEVCHYVNTSDIEELSVFSKYSSINKMQRILGYCLRFVFNVKNRNNKLIGNLSITELKNSFILILKHAQRKELGKEYQQVLSNKEIPSNLKSLFPFIDKDGLLRVGGRLLNAPISYSAKHPIILPKRNHITTLIIQNEHLNMLHAGPKQVIVNLKQRFWLLNANREVKKVLHKCVTCFRMKAKVAQQLMGSLPESRVNQCRVFEKVGVDFGGPFYIKQSRIRKSISTKGYIALFVCFVTKAIHIELVSDLTTESFMSALKRFVGRRGRPSIIYSDNGATFKGANNQLRELYKLLHNSQCKDKVEQSMLRLGIQWSFIPSYSPTFGGLWEAGIKSAKYHIKRVIGKTVLTYEQFNTILIQIEAILNARPLCQITHDVSNLDYLTPGHFIIGTTLLNVPECNDYSTIPINHLKFWKQCTKLQQSFWKIWSRDYLVQLQNRPKWKSQLPNLKEGMLVLVKDDNRHSLEWNTGRIVEVITGKDNKVRVIKVVTKNGTLVTSISKIAVLPIEIAN